MRQQSNYALCADHGRVRNLVFIMEHEVGNLISFMFDLQDIITDIKIDQENFTA